MLRSTDTVDSLLKLDERLLYQRLALWLLDADQSEISAFFEGYQKVEEPDEEVLKLLFSRWTKIDPAGAFRAAKSTDHEELAWWALSLNDPKAAIREVPEDFFSEVVLALGRFHPELVEVALAAHPDFSISSDSVEIARDLAKSDPGAALRLMRENGDEDETGVIADWTRKDPHSVLAWLEEHPDRTDGSFEKGFIETLEKEHPGLLAELAARARSGLLKWQLEGAAFRYLAKQDPAAALAMAEATESPRVKAERIAALGRQTLATDPQQAMARFEEVFQALPDAADRRVHVRSPDGTDIAGREVIAGLEEFVEGLVAADARAAMALAISHGEEAVEIVQQKWSSEDLDGFSTWLLEQPPGPFRDEGAAMVTRRLSDSDDYSGALAWTAEIADLETRASIRSNLLRGWSLTEPDAAEGWIEEADLPESERTRFTEGIQMRVPTFR